LICVYKVLKKLFLNKKILLITLQNDYYHNYYQFYITIIACIGRVRASHPTKLVGKYKRAALLYIFIITLVPSHRDRFSRYTCCTSNHIMDVKRYTVVVVRRILCAFLLTISPRPHHRSYQNPRQRPSAYHPLDETTRRRDGGDPRHGTQSVHS